MASPLKIDKARAAALFREEAALAAAGPVDQAWEDKVEHLSRLCSEGEAKTHIAFLGTSILAKAVSPAVDLLAIKPAHAPDNPNAYSARTLAHSVLVPLAAELGVHIGVTGREPLNNQPYFRMRSLNDGTPVHAGSRSAFNYMRELVDELRQMEDEDAVRQALRAFIAVRSRYQPRYIEHDGQTSITPDQLAAVIKTFVGESSEDGKRAQAVVAGLMDVFAGPARVESGRINDPSRRYPGDVCVRSASDPAAWEKALEVRDKPVTISDVQIFAKKCVDMGVREAAVVMVAERQVPLDAAALTDWANGFGIGLTLFHGWDRFVEQALFWSSSPKPDAAAKAVGLIHQRLVAVEVTPETVLRWQALTSS